MMLPTRKHPHLTSSGEFQSDKYPTTLPQLVPLKTTDPMAQDLLMIYAGRRRYLDEQFSDDVVMALANSAYGPAIDKVRARGAHPTHLWLKGDRIGDGAPTTLSAKVADGTEGERRKTAGGV